MHPDIPPILYDYARIPLRRPRGARMGCTCRIDDVGPVSRFVHGHVCPWRGAGETARKIYAKATTWPAHPTGAPLHPRFMWANTCIVPDAWGFAGGPEAWDDTTRAGEIMSDAVQFAVRAGVSVGRMVPPEHNGGLGFFEEVWAPLPVIIAARAVERISQVGKFKTTGESALVRHTSDLFNGKGVFVALRDRAFAAVFQYLAFNLIDGDANWRDYEGVFDKAGPSWVKHLADMQWDKFGERTIVKR